VDATPQYALEGSVFMGGAVVQWLRDGLSVLQTSADIEKLARSVPDSGGVVMVPAFAGLGAPYWNAEARGSMFGLTRGTTRAHLARAALEAIALQCTDLVQAMEADIGQRLLSLRVDGGASLNTFLMQLQADCLGIPIHRPTINETTALGAAQLALFSVARQQGLAGLTAGAAPQTSNDAANPIVLGTHVFTPSNQPGLAVLKQRWQQAIRATQLFSHPTE
jgi:glycerol kinase